MSIDGTQHVGVLFKSIKIAVEIMAHFHKIDQETTQKATKHVPIRLSGLSGQMATDLFTELPTKSFAKVLADLQVCDQLRYWGCAD